MKHWIPFQVDPTIFQPCVKFKPRLKFVKFCLRIAKIKNSNIFSFVAQLKVQSVPLWIGHRRGMRGGIWNYVDIPFSETQFTCGGCFSITNELLTRESRSRFKPSDSSGSIFILLSWLNREYIHTTLLTKQGVYSYYSLD